MTATYWISPFLRQERREKLRIARAVLLHQINTAKRDGCAGEVERVSLILERIERELAEALEVDPSEFAGEEVVT